MIEQHRRRYKGISSGMSFRCNTPNHTKGMLIKKIRKKVVIKTVMERRLVPSSFKEVSTVHYSPAVFYSAFLCLIALFYTVHYSPALFCCAFLCLIALFYTVHYSPAVFYSPFLCLIALFYTVHYSPAVFYSAFLC